MKRILLALSLLLLAAPVFAQNASSTQMQLVNSSTFTSRLHSSTTTAVTMQYQTVATGVALAFVASDIVLMNCVAF